MERTRRAGGGAVMVLCDGGCGLPHSASFMVVVGRWAACKDCAPFMRWWELQDRRDERDDPVLAAANAAARAELERLEGPYSVSARAVRQYWGLDREDGQSLVRGRGTR